MARVVLARAGIVDADGRGVVVDGEELWVGR
jgi:hypothetical protein